LSPDREMLVSSIGRCLSPDREMLVSPACIFDIGTPEAERRIST
jgi:hypothetical protein